MPPAPAALVGRLHLALCGATGTGRTTLQQALSAASPWLDVLEVDPREAWSREPDLILLTGLDLQAPGVDPRHQAVEDRALRAALQASGRSWRVVYGLGTDRLAQALQAVAEVAPWAWHSQAPEVHDGRWRRLQSACERCADPACEHRLFTTLTPPG